MFKDIPGYDGLYQIDIETQAVKSIPRKHIFGYMTKEKILKPYVRNDLYHSFTFSKGNKLEKVYLHRLVMLIKEGPCPEGMEVCHNDGNPANNHPDNLRYGTRQDNVDDMWKHGKGYNIHDSWAPTNKKCYMKNSEGDIKEFNSATSMANYLQISHTLCTYLIRKGKICRGKFKGNFFTYL